MDALRALQLLTDLAYLALGIAAVVAAARARERARLDVAILFGALGGIVALQELRLVSCSIPGGCVDVPFSMLLTMVMVPVLPYALLRLVDDIADIPPWQMWLSGVLFIGLAAIVVVSVSPPGWLVALLLSYLVAGTAFATWAFASRAITATGITRRRMAAVAWGCGLLAATIILTVLAPASPTSEGVLTFFARLAGLISGLCFWAGYFPPNWLSQTWRLPELVGYLRPTRLMAAPHGDSGVATDAIAIDRLCAATAATTGARRVLLILEDPTRHDLYLWGAPSARMDPAEGLVARVLRTGQPSVIRDVTPAQLPSALVNVFASETLPRTAILVPIALESGASSTSLSSVGILAAFAQKGPMFVEDDVEIVSFFAAEASAILRIQRYRQSVNELEALREADRLKDEFMAVVSHELRTPLTAISGYSDILLRKLSGPLNDRQERQVIGIRDAARRLLVLINDLLDVSKLEAGTLDLHLQALDVPSSIERAATAVRVIAATKGVDIQVRQPDGPLAPVLADDARLQQILTNLLMNSIKFTPQHGSVWIGASVEMRADGTDEIVFRVEDTGVGLSPEQAARVWDRFYQVESSSTRRFGGAGLGLSIVRRLAELHGGRVEASSPGLNRGSLFAVRLPTAAPGDAAPGQPTRPTAAIAADPVGADQSPEPNPAEPLVLVVEDDAPIATVLRTYLEADGYRVAVADNGQAAIQAARTLEPFAITLDISLPKLDGWSVLNALKREPATSHIPVIVVSIVDNRDFGLVLGATDYLVKPIDHDRLRAVLRSLDSLRNNTGDDGTVLVVDDDPSLREVLRDLLAEDGWRVVTASDGDDALAVIARERPTAVVLDLMMPRLDGFQVLKVLRDQPATHDLPVIVVTARELNDEDRRRLAHSAEQVILKKGKPIDDLRREIHSLLTLHRSRTNHHRHADGVPA